MSREQREEKPTFVLLCSLTTMFDLIKPKGAPGIRGHVALCILLGLLVSAAFSQATDSPQEEVSFLKQRLNSLTNRYRLLCNQYTSLAASCSYPVINCTQCPNEWFQVGDQCFYINTHRQSWFNSSEDCKEKGGHLAILTTKEQHAAVEKESRRIAGFYTDYWIGLTDIENEGEWKWVDNSPLKIPFWDTLKSEPSNDLSGGPEGEDCAVVDSRSQQWYDVPCSYLYPHICQMDAIPLQ